jgi:hypothetical protein
MAAIFGKIAPPPQPRQEARRSIASSLRTVCAREKCRHDRGIVILGRGREHPGMARHSVE